MMRLLSMACLMMVALFLSCGETREHAAEVPVDPSEARILSLAPNITEMLYALGLEDRIVGVTDFCVYPAEAASKERVGGLHDVTVERAITLDPTHVLHMGQPSDAVRRLGQRGLRIVSIPSESTAEVTQGIRTLGEMFDVAQRAGFIADEIESSLQSIRDLYAERDTKRALYVVGHAPGALREVYVAGPSTFLDEYLQIANADNIMAESAAPYPLLSREWAMANRPDVILTSKGDGTQWSESEEAQMTRLWRDFLGLESSDDLRIVFLTDPHLTIPGPSIARSAGRIAAAIHGED